jgi:hypothetical protein
VYIVEEDGYMAATAVGQIRFPHITCVDRDPVPENGVSDAQGPPPPPDIALLQKIREIEKTFLTASIPSSAIPEGAQPIIHRAIADLRDLLRVPQTHRTVVIVFLEWLRDRAICIARAVYKLFFWVFRKAPPDVTVQAILDELKLSMAITPAQYETVLQMAQKADKKLALILLSTFLGFPTAELSPLLMRSLNASPQYAFSVLLECSLIKKFSADEGFREIMNAEDRACLLTVSVENLESFDRIKEQLRCLRSLSYRRTVRTWIANLSDLLKATIPLQTRQQCIGALRDNDVAAFTRALTPYLERIASSQPLCNESLYAKELLDGFSISPSFDALATEIRAQKFLSCCGARLRELKSVAQAFASAASVSEAVNTALKKTCDVLDAESLRSTYIPSVVPICETFRAAQLGSLARSKRKLAAISQVINGRYRPLAGEQKPSKHILNLTCSCGNGHNVMVRALNDSLGAAATRSKYQFSTEALDVPVDVIRSTDTVYRILHQFGLQVDTTELYNFLLRNDLCSVIHLLKKIRSETQDPIITERKRSLIRQAVLAKDPDLLNMVYAFDGLDVDRVSQETGLPLVYVATDLDLDDWSQPPTSPFFREAVPSLHNAAIRETLHIPEEKVVEVGLCVGPEFETALTVEQLDAVRAKYGIAPGEKVVLFSSGGAALQNSIPERIALGYDNPAIPIHVIVVCGRNELFKKRLEEEVLPNIPQDSSVSMTVLGFQGRSSMAELTQLADVVIGKPGGMSSMEFLKTGTQVIFDETGFRMGWELHNANVVVNSGHGVVMTRQEDILSLLSSSLRRPRRPPASMARIRGSERYVGLVSDIVSQADRPAERQGWREKRRSWHKMNKTMVLSTIC